MEQTVLARSSFVDYAFRQPVSGVGARNGDAAPLMRIIDSIADGDFYLHDIAVDDELRGDGVGSVFMYSVEERARTSGTTRLSLDVSAKNEARQFYERRGWKVESQWPKRLAIPGLKFYRMTKGL